MRKNINKNTVIKATSIIVDKPKKYKKKKTYKGLEDICLKCKKPKCTGVCEYFKR